MQDTRITFWGGLRATVAIATAFVSMLALAGLALTYWEVYGLGLLNMEAYGGTYVRTVELLLVVNCLTLSPQLRRLVRPKTPADIVVGFIIIGALMLGAIGLLVSPFAFGSGFLVLLAGLAFVISLVNFWLAAP